MNDSTNLFNELNKPEVKRQYYEGLLNKLIRVYFYLDQGLDLLNQFKYLAAGILAIFYLLKLDGWQWMVLMFAIALPILTIAGHFWVHKAKKPIEYTGLKYTTYFGQYQFRLQERQLELLENLHKEIMELNYLLRGKNIDIV